MTLLVIDPYLVHAYWDVSPEQAAASIGAVLRVHDTTTDVPGHFDLPVSLAARNWYIHVWNPERSYYAELGVVENGGGFIPLARSNTVETPRAWPVAAPVEVQSVVQVPLLPEPALPDGSGQVTEPARGLPSVEPAPIPTPIPGCARERAEVPPAPETPRVPTPINTAETLRTTLQEVYASRQWIRRVSQVGESAARTPQASYTANHSPDLTDLAEEHFFEGVSSKPSEPPA